MFRDRLSGARALFVGVVFFVLVVGGSLLYRWHVHRTTESDMERHDRLLQGRQNQNETRPPETVNVSTENETPGFVNTPRENTDAPMSDEREALENETETLDRADAFLPDAMVSEEVSAEDVPVSPFGFGPYPELPEGWPADQIWPCISADHELMARVMVKLAHQGTITKGSIMENGLVYPTYPGAVYIRWAYKEKNGALYIADVSGDEDALDRISAIEETSGDTFKKADIPPDIKVLSFEEDGIEPYTFLNLQ